MKAVKPAGGCLRGRVGGSALPGALVDDPPAEKLGRDSHSDATAKWPPEHSQLRVRRIGRRVTSLIDTYSNEPIITTGTDEATKDDRVLEEKLRKAPGVSVAELAVLAEHWPH